MSINKCSKLIDGFKNLIYQERLNKLNLPTLAFCCLRVDMIEVYKHLNYYEKSTLDKWFKICDCPNRQHDFQLVVRFPKYGSRGVEHNSFYIRAIKPWNKLPRDVSFANLVQDFKGRLNNVWRHHPRRFTIV